MYADGESLPRTNDVHHYNTRNVHLYSLPVHRLRLYERKPSYMGMKLHNLLPPHLLSKRGKDLKIALHQWLLDRPFYTLEDDGPAVVVFTRRRQLGEYWSILIRGSYIELKTEVKNLGVTLDRVLN
ncbi:hypothetical protein J6590_006241 [Homalodisca vitripennis]|nr:hypothetical protein J6590_006241 [Homalodisca vitripennis]